MRSRTSTVERGRARPYPRDAPVGRRHHRHAPAPVAAGHRRVHRRLPRAIRLELPARRAAGRRPHGGRPCGRGRCVAGVAWTPRVADRRRGRGGAARRRVRRARLRRRPARLDGAARAGRDRPGRSPPGRRGDAPAGDRRVQPVVSGDVRGRRGDARGFPPRLGGARRHAFLRGRARRGARGVLRAVPARGRRAGGGCEHARARSGAAARAARSSARRRRPRARPAPT